ncbi:hypothetical protein TWF281_009473 [Arthrobotrys megalospora]
MVGFFLAGVAFFQVRHPSAVTRTTKSAIQTLRTGSIGAALKKGLLKFFSRSPVFWLVTGLAAFIIGLIIQDTRMLAGIHSIKITLNRILRSVKQLGNVSKSDMGKLTSWRWEVIPWADYIIQPKPALVPNGPVE